MHRINRRDFLRFAGASVGALAIVSPARAAQSARVVVIGGGFGGVTCARYLKVFDPTLEVMLIEPEPQFVTGPASNYVLGGFRALRRITLNYDALQTKYGITLIHDLVISINAAKKTVTLKNGKRLGYDRLVVSPGVDFSWGAIKYYDPASANAMPHAWKAGPQTTLLRKKLEAMRNGGRFLIVAPANPYRCPPGPYERASLVAYYLKRHKPRSKIIILDAKDDFPKKDLFMDGWNKFYPGMIEWVPGAQGGKARSVNVHKLVVDTELDRFKGDVVNVIPPQNAGRIAYVADLVNDSGWCPVEARTFESKKQKGVYVIGDAAIAGDMPKSAFAANSQAKIAAAAIVSELQGRTPAEPLLLSTCYSLLAPDYGISIAGVYRATADGIKLVPGSGGVSPREANLDFRAEEAKYAIGWYASITADGWG